MADWAQTYQNTLGRAPSQSELSFWQNAGPNAAADFNFAAQQELGGRAKSVDFGSLYKNTLGREGTADELNYWKGSTFTDPSTAFFDAAQKELSKRPDAAANKMWLTNGAGGDLLGNPNFWGMTKAEQQANSAIGRQALADGTLPMQFGSSGFGAFGSGGGTGGTGGGGAGSMDWAAQYKNILGRDPNADELAYWNKYTGPNAGGAFNAAASSELGGRSAALAKQQQEFEQRMAQRPNPQIPDYKSMFDEFARRQQSMMQDQQMQMMQDQQRRMMQDWSSMAGFKKPTWGPGSGQFGNFGGNTSPVYRPDDPTAGPRNGWGGPWGASNPWAPTF